MSDKKSDRALYTICGACLRGDHAACINHGEEAPGGERRTNRMPVVYLNSGSQPFAIGDAKCQCVCQGAGLGRAVSAREMSKAADRLARRTERYLAVAAEQDKSPEEAERNLLGLPVG